jgi:hypothetical protein
MSKEKRRSGGSPATLKSSNLSANDPIAHAPRAQQRSQLDERF